MAETVGLIASVIQVAGAGLKLSQTLYQYADGVATADRRIKDIAKEIQLTSFVITELGDVFKDGETSTLMSKNAVTTANETMKECSSVFAEIDATLKKSKKNTLGRLMLPFRDNKIELLRNHIDKLKSTLLLLMQVLSHAHQIASQKLDREAEAKQKAQIQELIELKKKSAKKYEESLRNFSIGDEDTLNEGDNSASDKTSLINDSTPSLTFAAAAISSSINPRTLETCVNHIRTLLEDIETLQQALANQVDGSDHSEHHQSLVGSYFRARGHLDSVLFKGMDEQSVNEGNVGMTVLSMQSTEVTRKTPIKIKDISDTSGRTFSLPFKSCHNWTGLHSRLKRIYDGVDHWRDHAAGGQFDILDSQGYAILPDDWEETVEPGMMLTLRFRGPPMIPSSNYTNPELIDSKQTAHENMEVVRPESTNQSTMKGFRQRVVPVSGTNPLPPKVMKRKDLKGLALKPSSLESARSSSDGEIPADHGAAHKDLGIAQRDPTKERNLRQSLEIVALGSRGSEPKRATALRQGKLKAIASMGDLVAASGRRNERMTRTYSTFDRPASTGDTTSTKRQRRYNFNSRAVDLDEKEPLLFQMSEIGAGGSRHSLEKARFGSSTTVVETERRPRPSRRRSISRRGRSWSVFSDGRAGVESRERSRSRHSRKDPLGRKSEKWEQAAKAAIVAGAVEAFRSRKAQSPWTGEKGQRIATCALGAAGIDRVINRNPDNHRMRQVIESALGGITASRLTNGSRSRSRSRPRTELESKSRSRSRSIFGRSRSRSKSHGTGDKTEKAESVDSEDSSHSDSNSDVYYEDTPEDDAVGDYESEVESVASREYQEPYILPGPSIHASQLPVSADHSGASSPKSTRDTFDSPIVLGSIPPPPPPPNGPGKPLQYIPWNSLSSSGLPLPPPPLPSPPPPSSAQSKVPLASATYIPHGESFGPGIGIPPLTTKVENKKTPAVASALEMDEVDALLKEWTTVFR